MIPSFPYTVPEYIKSIEFIEQNINYIDSEMTEKLDGSDIHAISAKMTDLMAYRPVSNDMVSSARYYLNAMREIEYNKQLSKGLSPSVLKELVRSATKDWEWLYDKCERLNKGLTHYLDECRSLMSKEKELHRQMI